MISYKFLSVSSDIPSDSYWDMTLIKDIFKDSRFTPAVSEGAIVVLPGKNQGKYINKINEELNKLSWVVLIITSDEEHNFPVEKINHRNIKIYIQNPKQGRHDNYNMWPLGYTSETRKHLKLLPKTLDYFLSAQDTHKRRHDAFNQLRKVKNGVTNRTDGFTEGLNQEEYMTHMCQAKIVPSPAGPVCAESFRLYEALEAGAIPIGDNISATGDYDYWQYLFPNKPFPTINNYLDLPGYIEDQLNNFQDKANHIQAWWIREKRLLKHFLSKDVADLGGPKFADLITVVIPCSPIPSHPDIRILEETIRSVKYHLPNSEIIITFDGVRQQQEKMHSDYEEFIRRVLFMCNTEWDATPFIFDKHTHQVGMLREVIDYIDSPLMLYVEMDTPLVFDREIDWEFCSNKIINGIANMIRFHFEAIIPKDHEHLMIGYEDKLIKTVQWSQRPHLASVAFYKRILHSHFSENAKSFIEDQMHGILFEAYKIDGMLGWQQYKVYIYAPDKNLKYSYHTDGRQSGLKYDEQQVF